MSKKSILLLAVVLVIAALAPATIAATEDLDTPNDQEAQAIPETEMPANESEATTCSATADADLGMTAPMFVAFVPCEWGKICRNKRDCGHAGYCQIQYGGWGVCGCY